MKNSFEAISGRPFPVFLKFTLPNILSIIAISSSGVVDAIFLGRYAGEASLAAVNIINPFFNFCFGLGVMLTIGGSVRAGKYIGEGSIEKASAVFTKTVLTIAASAFLISFLCFIFSEKISLLLGANSELLPICSLYLQISACFVVFSTLSYALSIFIRVDGRPFLASAGLVVTGISNIILDYILVGILGYGAAGAASATGIAGLIGFLVLISHFVMKKSKMKIIITKKGWGELFAAAYNGLSEFISEISAGVIMLAFNRIMIAGFGTSGVAAFTAINYLIWAGIMIDYATSDALTPLISINYGAKKPERIKSFTKAGMAFVFGNGLTIFILMTIIPDVLVGLFIPDREAAAFKIAIDFAFYVKWAFLINGINQIFSAYFTALHRPLESALISGARGLVLPLLFLWIFPLFMGNIGIYTAVPAAEIVTITGALFLYKYYGKHIKI